MTLILNSSSTTLIYVSNTTTLASMLNIVSTVAMPFYSNTDVVENIRLESIPQFQTMPKLGVGPSYQGGLMTNNKYSDIPINVRYP